MVFILFNFYRFDHFKNSELQTFQLDHSAFFIFGVIGVDQAVEIRSSFVIVDFIVFVFFIISNCYYNSGLTSMKLNP